MKHIEESRTKKTIINSLSGMATYCIVMVCTMLSRILFARYLGEELLGLNSLYASIVDLLQITELGIGAAFIVFLYEPIKNSNQEKITAIMYLYRRIYNIFSLTLLIVGTIVTIVVIPYMTTSNKLNIQTIQLYFFLYLLGIVASYVVSYSKSIFYAEQKNWLLSVVNSIQIFIVSMLQIIVIIFYGSYFLYLVIRIIGFLLENVICHMYIIREYPYLKKLRKIKLEDHELQNIKRVVKSVFITRLADKILAQSDSILINQFINTITLGLYSNYNTIFNACSGLFGAIGSSLTSSYGSMATNSTAEVRYNGYKKSYKLCHWIALLFSVYFLIFIQDFIFLAYGQSYILSNTICILLTVYLYLYLTKTIYYSYQNALGMHRIDQKQMIYQVIVNIIISLIGVKFFGLEGVILGTIVSLFMFSIVYKGSVIFDQLFEVSRSIFYKNLLKDLIFASIIFLMAYISTNIYPAKNIKVFVFKLFFFGMIFFALTSVDLIFNKDIRNTIKRKKIFRK